MGERDYYQRRLEQELARAASAESSAVIAAHRGMAELYELRLRKLGQHRGHLDGNA